MSTTMMSQVLSESFRELCAPLNALQLCCHLLTFYHLLQRKSGVFNWHRQALRALLSSTSAYFRCLQQPRLDRPPQYTHTLATCAFKSLKG